MGNTLLIIEDFCYGTNSWFHFYLSVIIHKDYMNYHISGYHFAIN